MLTFSLLYQNQDLFFLASSLFTQAVLMMYVQLLDVAVVFLCDAQMRSMRSPNELKSM